MKGTRTRIVVLPAGNPLQLETVTGHVEGLGLERLLPGWCARLAIRFHQNDADLEYASTVVQKQYREAEVGLRPRFFAVDPQLQRAILLHEVAHLFTRRAQEVAQQTIALHYDEGAVRTQLLRVIDDEFEGATEDIALAMLALTEE